jgi:hypothetical protein
MLRPSYLYKEAPDNVNVGAYIGVRHSADRGLNGTLLQKGMPYAPVAIQRRGCYVRPPTGAEVI